MKSLAAQMRDGLDALIFDQLGGETAVISGNTVRGIMNKKYREIEARDGTIVGFDLSFDCQHQVFMDALAPGDSLTVEGISYKFRRQVPPGGDESGLVILDLASVAVVPLPVAAFVAEPVLGEAPLTVAFTDRTTNAPVSWDWKKKLTSGPGGWVSFAGLDEQNPIETFGPGTWAIRLTAANAAGSDTEEKADYIRATLVRASARPVP